GMAVLILLNILGGFFTYSNCSAADGKLFPNYSIPILTGGMALCTHVNDFKRPANDGKNGLMSRLLHYLGSLQGDVVKDFNRLTLYCSVPGRPFPKGRSRLAVTNGRDPNNDVLYT
ncbi:MAG: hypothetical protein ACWGNK_04500, partial [Desulfobacterales bacterium]